MRNGREGRYQQRQAAKKARRRRKRRFLLLLLIIGGFFWVRSRLPQLRLAALRRSGCPESLVELAERQPEAYSFAKDYRKYANAEPPIDLSGEVRQGSIPLFIQWDKRWGYHLYGGDYLALTGCGPTCLSMVYCGLTGTTEWNPLRTAQWAEENGFYVEGVGSAWSLMSQGAQWLGLTVKEASPDAQVIRDSLEAGKVLICSVGPGDFTREGHFIVLTGMTDSGRIRVNDPNSRKRSQKTWEAERLVSQMNEMWIYG